MAIPFLLPREHDPVRIKALLDASGITTLPLGVSLLGILLTSFHMGFTVGWVRTGWWGLSFLLLLGMVLWMTWYSRNYYTPIRKALGGFHLTGLSTPNPAVEDKVIDMKDVESLIRKTNPHLLARVGVIVTGALVWLMRFKPF